MRTLTLPLTATVLALAAHAAPAPLPKLPPPASNKADLKAMQGKWTRTLLILAGTTIRKARGAEVTVTITGDRMVYSPTDTWKLTLDAKAKPKRIDARGFPPHADTLFLGVYRLEKDKLTVYWRQTEARRGGRVLRFDPSQRGVWYCVYERIKP
jgi:uncharacterized protein (TIGR03067 family)